MPLITKALALMASAPLLLSANSLTVPSPFTGSFAVVPKVDCVTGSGSGVRISDDVVITARHVTEGKPSCSVFGKPLTITHKSVEGYDFVAAKGDFGPGLRAIISCRGIFAGERYQAFGYAHGGEPNVEPLIGSDEDGGAGRIVLRGTLYPGMSGGAVFDDMGAVVGIIIARGIDPGGGSLPRAWVLPLSKTYLCKGGAA